MLQDDTVLEDQGKSKDEESKDNGGSEERRVHDLGIGKVGKDSEEARNDNSLDQREDADHIERLNCRLGKRSSLLVDRVEELLHEEGRHACNPSVDYSEGASDLRIGDIDLIQHRSGNIQFR